MKTRFGAVILSLALAAFALLARPAGAAGQLGVPKATPLGMFAGIAYVQYDGLFEGSTSTGAYRVPYRIAAPADPVRANRTVLVELPHPIVGLLTRAAHLGEGFLFSRGFTHAGIGWSTTKYGKNGGFRIVDPDVPGVFIDGGFHDTNGRTDDEIAADFGAALVADPQARSMLGRVDRRYLTGVSDAADPVQRLIRSGSASGVFDFTLPVIAVGPELESSLAAGIYGGKLIIVNSQAEGASRRFIDQSAAPDQYRLFVVAGSPHIPDDLVPSFNNRTTPAGFQPALRAHFLQGHAWVRSGTPPPPSTHLKAGVDGTLALDQNGNAIAVNAGEQPVPRLPFVELGEAHFIGSFIGSYDSVKTIRDLGFAGHDAYLRAFEGKLGDHLKAGHIGKDDADAMRRRAALCAPLTFTETYRDHYDAFVAIVGCGG